jgi:uncharacterized protein YbjQ (UPF0145 family)
MYWEIDSAMDLKRTPAIACLACLVISGCSPVGIEVERTGPATARDAGRASDFAAVAVYEDKAPDRPYEEIARLKATAVSARADRGDMTKALRRKAAKLGADAIIGLRFAEETYDQGDGGGMVCPILMECTYMQNDEGISSRLVAEATAVRFNGE